MSIAKHSPAIAVILVATAVSTHAVEKKHAMIECKPAEQQLVYDCMIMLKGKKSGEPISGAEFTVGANMPSMPGAHTIRPVPAMPHGKPGMYHSRIELQMFGEWALSLDFSKPNRDRVVKKLQFGKSVTDMDHTKQKIHKHGDATQSE